ncbi:MAG TPA: methyltransferase domain-containing protein [Syntrophorhabdaceae bacterium]|nr:methyltransferase domain-containing protein [Syntrophorhabdaceae bacterium]
MHDSFIQYLCDPLTKEPLDVEIIHENDGFIFEGYLYSATNRFPIVRGIPRFSGYQENNSYAHSFGYQWNKWAKVQFESHNVGKPMEGWTLRMWEKITTVTAKDMRNALVVDFGCGSGRFIEIARMKNARVIGIDLSASVESAYESFKNDRNVLIVQGDMLNPPIKCEAADGAFSIGVLHHTPDPRRGVEKMAKSVKKGGWVAISVYSKGGYYDFPTVKFYRKLFKLLERFFRYLPPLIYSLVTVYVISFSLKVPLMGRIIRSLFPYIKLPDKKWSLLDTFDSVTPSYQSAHEPYEVFTWFKDLGLIEIEPSDWGFTSYHAVKPK